MAANNLHRGVKAQLVIETELEKEKKEETKYDSLGKRGVREESECVKLKMRYEAVVYMHMAPVESQLLRSIGFKSCIV